MKNHQKSIQYQAVFQWLLMLSVGLHVHSESSATDVYVSVGGHAQADGSVEKPYGSIPDAVSAVRELRAAGDSDPIVIYLREGRYQLDETLVLGLQDGNPTATKVPLEKHGAGQKTRPAHLTFAAYPGEQPVVSGGVPITGWKRLESPPSEMPVKAAGKVWVADMPAGLGRFHCCLTATGVSACPRMLDLRSQNQATKELCTSPKGH